ncbi:agamous-like MADS-box protein MADS9 [Amaranthus tricolor]|uniref:agamous-like MADS-box protein MADS9 n=1 Tax=Amaranthus tricolor TaxID=29722 RepID=UPI00258C43C2|nr:agamous-like MADS-box protein MADS9 [Amaranthus tricolor]XP_057531873.1 agamous-like MADS-box protein MADS9 [Amaranthus tricolor]XP_057531874.1 agamous-like MADS-box protein MADS9 [Amaranthus tricolor]
MGRGKIEIKRIENTTNRQVTYTKRKNGIIKKAKEISVLCDAKVSVVIFANNGKMHGYHTSSSSVPDILEQYQTISGKRIWDAKHENLKNEIDRIKKENDDMRIELRHLKGEDVGSLPHPDLMRLEDALETGLVSVRNKKKEIRDMYERNTMKLEEENNRLNFILHKQEMKEYPYEHQSLNYRVQPMQPNLQDHHIM